MSVEEYSIGEAFSGTEFCVTRSILRPLQWLESEMLDAFKNAEGNLVLMGGLMARR